ncbi:hypothetical protein H2199_005671 [Coniosporium tulheliwenetii]|uniref:Uncharacterized protein n=1 Tax=Coniosporium tulheliwenetii TaxID=3383036 RepID=A0ACC2Z196_9PEZI|nr:hypothetical protein H2199_005671 [Cladosporium sp. JES 115]
MDILHQQATSGFLKIPVELRTMIYKGLLPHNYLITFRPYTHAKDTGSDRAVYRGFIIEFGSRNMGEDVLEERSTAIMRVNKQIYAEIVDCLYRQNDYVFIQARDKG